MEYSPTHQDKKILTGALTFPEAMQKVIEGKSVTRVSWGDSSIYVCICEGFLRIVDKEDGLLHQLLVSEVDMRASDWAETP